MCYLQRKKRSMATILIAET